MKNLKVKAGVNPEGLFSDDPKVKYGTAKELIAVARENPAGLYPRLEFFAKLLESDNNILKWTAIDIIGYLARVDRAKKIDSLMGRLCEFLGAGKLITASHAISALANIVAARPEYRDKINAELLKVERYNYDTEECRNIALGKVILAVDTYFAGLEDRQETIEFVKRQTGNARPTTRKKAEKFLLKYLPG